MLMHSSFITKRLGPFMSLSCAVLISCGCGGGGGTLAPQPPDFQNPGFETPAIVSGTYQEPPPTGFGWTGSASGFGVANGAGAWGFNAEAGSQYAFLQSANTTSKVDQGFCQQTVKGFIVGRSYQVTFYMSQRIGNEGGNYPVQITLTANGTTIFGPMAPAAGGTWAKYTSSTFTATTDTYTFAFTTPPQASTLDQTSLLDETHVVSVP
jgi:hypothetical protein